MDTYEHESEHRKKRRRREIAPKPTSARLTFDDTLKNDIAIVSPTLWPILVEGKLVIAFSCCDTCNLRAKVMVSAPTMLRATEYV
jgi:transcription elongation factor Elf1